MSSPRNVSPSKTDLYAYLEDASRALQAIRDAEQGLAEKLYSLDREFSKLSQNLDRFIWSVC